MDSQSSMGSEFSGESELSHSEEGRFCSGIGSLLPIVFLHECEKCLLNW